MTTLKIKLLLSLIPWYLSLAASNFSIVANLHGRPSRAGFISAAERTSKRRFSSQKPEPVSTASFLTSLLLSDAEPGAYSYTNKERCEELVRYDLVRPDNDPEVADAERIALMSWRELNGRDAGRIDLRSDGNGSPNFIEANPLAGLHPEHSDLPMLATRVGMSYNELIRQIVESAAKRV